MSYCIEPVANGYLLTIQADRLDIVALEFRASVDTHVPASIDMLSLQRWVAVRGQVGEL